MRSNYKKLGDFIRTVDERNSDLAITNLQGVSITKEFVPSIANIIGTDLSTYKIVRTGQFAYGPVTSRNGNKVSIALLKNEDCIISSSYVPFEVYKPDELLPDYLMLWFMRPEFDRYARFMSNGSAREVFDWDCMCDVELPVPSVSEQRKIVWEFHMIAERIALLQKMNSLQEELIKTMYRKAKAVAEDRRKTITVSDFCKVFTGKKDVNQAVANGKNRFYSCSPTPARSNDAIYEGRAILVAGNGSYTGRTTFVDEAFDLYQRTYALTPIDKNCIELFLIYAALQTDFQEQIESKLHGSAIPYIVYGDLADFSFEIDDEYQFIGENIKTLVYLTIKNDLEIEQLSSLTSLMLSSLSSSDKNEVRK